MSLPNYGMKHALVGGIVTFLLFSCIVHAQLENGIPSSLALQDAFGEVIVDHTITPQGHEFYRAFITGMNEEDQPPVHFTSISVEERPHSRSGSLISVENEQGQIVQVTIYAGAAGQVELMGKRVAAYVRQRLNERQFNGIFADPDLGSSDFK